MKMEKDPEETRLETVGEEVNNVGMVGMDGAVEKVGEVGAVGRVELMGWEEVEWVGLKEEIELVEFFQYLYLGSPLKSCSWDVVPALVEVPSYYADNHNDRKSTLSHTHHRRNFRTIHHRRIQHQHHPPYFYRMFVYSFRFL